ncbi:hypothetical protein HispidOSU_013180 [Sigmodon hispidus]
MSLCHVTVRFSGVYLLKIYSCTQAWRTWILSVHLVSSFEHHCADPTSHLPRLGFTSVPCCPAYIVAVEQIYWTHITTGHWSNAYTQKVCPRYAVEQLLAVGHADLGSSLEACVPYSEMDGRCCRVLTGEVEDWNRKPVSMKPALTVR